MRAWVAGNLYEAYVGHVSGHSEMEWKCLGAAVHAIEDSYSSAHVFRDANAASDPHARIEALNNFSPLTHHQTHDSTFDQVAISDGILERATDQAAVLDSYAVSSEDFSLRLWDAQAAD